MSLCQIRNPYQSQSPKAKKQAFLALAGAGLCLSLVAGASFAADGTKVSEKDYQLPKCAAPVASVLVGKLTCKAAGCQPPATGGNSQLEQLIRLSNGGAGQANFQGIGDGMSAMLTTTLKETGCFDIQEREAMDELAKELALVGKKVEVQQADFMISGSITSINMNTDKKALGGGFIPIIGMIAVTTNTADIGLDIKIIDVNRAKVLESRTFQANNETTSTSFGAGGFGGGGLLVGGLSSIKNTPMEPIIRDVLAQVASYSASKLLNTKGAGAVVANTNQTVPASTGIVMTTPEAAPSANKTIPPVVPVASTAPAN